MAAAEKNFFYNTVTELFSAAPFSYLSFAVLDFSSQKSYWLELKKQFFQAPRFPNRAERRQQQFRPYRLIHQDSTQQRDPHSPEYFFDLASLTKPLSLGILALSHPELFNDQLRLLLNHQAGLPPHGFLDARHDQWKKNLKRYQIESSPTLYSDYSALRLQLELEKSLQESLLPFLKKNVFHNQSDQPLYWRELYSLPKSRVIFPPTGERNRRLISGEVHDDNAYHLPQFCAHAGFFSSIQRLSSFLFFLDQTHHLLNEMNILVDNKSPSSRFACGFDTVTDPLLTLAGLGHSSSTFGHLGFTGTSFWIDPLKKRGHILLTNATEQAWFPRDHLQKLRKFLGSQSLTMDITGPSPFC